MKIINEVAHNFNIRKIIFECHSVDHHFVNKMNNDTCDFKEKLNKLLTYSKKVYPGTVNNHERIYNKISNFNYDNDIMKLKNWIGTVIKEEPPEEKINKFWISINNLVYGTLVCPDFGISGSENDKWSYSPKRNRFPKTIGLTRVYSILEKYKELKDAQYVLCLGIGTILIKEVLKSLKQDNLLSSFQNKDIIFGYNINDSINIGQIL